MNVQTEKLGKTLATALVAAAIAAPTALGSGGNSLDPWAYNAIYGNTSSATPIGENAAGQRAADAGAKAIQRSSPSVPRGENATGQGRIPATRPDNRASVRGPATPIALSAPTVTNSGGFNWGDAGIGAAGSFALMLLGLSATITALRRRQRQEALPGGIA